MATTVDLADVAVVDNHCHGVERGTGRDGVAAWRALFSESPDPVMRSQAVADTVFYQRLLTEMAEHHGVAPTRRRCSRPAARTPTTSSPPGC